jgi:hypothetical protein
MTGVTIARRGFHRRVAFQLSWAETIVSSDDE